VTQLAKILGILANFLLFSYLSIQDESGTFIILYFIISFYGVIENQLFYFLKNKSNLQTSRDHQKNRGVFSGNDIVTYVYLIILSCLCIVLLYFSIPKLIGDINLTILLSVIIFKLIASFIEIFYEMIGYGERSFIVKNLVLFLAAAAVVAVDQLYFIQTHFLLILYYILSSVLSILFILFFISKDDGGSFHRVHQDVQGSSLKFQMRLLFSTLIGYISGQYLFLMIPNNGLEFYKFTAILFVFGGVVVTVASSSIISKRAIKESNDSLRNNSGFWLVLVSYVSVLFIPFFIKIILEIFSLFVLIDSQIIDKITHLTLLIHSDIGTKIIVIMMISNMILIQLIKTAIFYRRLIIEPIYYSNFIILTIIALYYFINITVTPLVFVSLNLVFALTVLLELLIFKRNNRSERNNF